MMSGAPQQIGVVITTYNSPLWLSHVLTGYEQQTDADFTVWIADDGSTQDTSEVVQLFQQRGRLLIEHIWHPDEGFRKCTILNRVIAQSSNDYLIFTDGDCIPRADFVAVHRANARANTFLSGGYIKLTQAVSNVMTAEAIASQAIFDAQQLVAMGQPKSHKLWKLTRTGAWQRWLNRLTPTAATWNGMNSSTWRTQLLAVNGFNEQMQYGGLDRELGERLVNAGVRRQQIRYSAVCLHLEHARGYAKPEIWARNRTIRAEVRRNKQTWTPHGLNSAPNEDTR